MGVAKKGSADTSTPNDGSLNEVDVVSSGTDGEQVDTASVRGVDTARLRLVNWDRGYPLAPRDQMIESVGKSIPGSYTWQPKGAAPG